MKTMDIGIFKTYALKVVDQVSKSHESIIITKRGRPIAKLVPLNTTFQKSLLVRG
ncbi:MAG: type II toxin-antitoxin system prevent-host-death family antitoxin [Thermodesulfobacteriota bacterium]|nr:type II toxin-antitoxin system prevent-host-death family antitoxin [Thermodesulfobacteriota bacterium]